MLTEEEVGAMMGMLLAEGAGSGTAAIIQAILKLDQRIDRLQRVVARIENIQEGGGE
jgi:hypothetical protein